MRYDFQPDRGILKAAQIFVSRRRQETSQLD
jgi:hypothetical protein